MGTGNRQRLAQTHGAEFGAGQVDIEVVDLVHHQEALLVTTAQVLADHLVGGGHAGTRVHQKQHGIGLFDGLQRLLGHLRVDALLVTGITDCP